MTEPDAVVRLTRLSQELGADRGALDARAAEIEDLLRRWNEARAISRPELVLVAVNLHGWYTALETALERVHASSIRRRGLISGNHNVGLVISGSTGEAATCSVEERRNLWRFVHERVKGRIPVVAGTGTNNTAESIALTRIAEELGLDGVMAGQ